MRKWIIAIIIVLLLAYVGAAYLYGRNLRYTGIIEGRYFLKHAAKDFAEQGHIVSFSSTDWRVWLSTNRPTIGGTQYVCYVEAAGGNFFDEGTLAMTTNGTFIWLDRKHPPKVLDPSYRPPIFPPRF